MRVLNDIEIMQVHGGNADGALLGFFSGLATGFGVCAVLLQTQSAVIQLMTIALCTISITLLGCI